MMRPLRVALVIALLAVASACSGDEPDASTTPTPTVTDTSTPTATPTATGNPAGANSVSIIDNAFDPPELTVTVGTEVTWLQASSAVSTHTVTAADGSFASHPNCKTDLSACMKPGESFRHRFATVGRFLYTCDIHGPLMSGTIVVQ